MGFLLDALSRVYGSPAVKEDRMTMSRAILRIGGYGRVWAIVALVASITLSHGVACAAPVSVSIPGNLPFVFDATAPNTTFWLDVSLPDSVHANEVTVDLITVRRNKQVNVVAGSFVVDRKLVDDDRLSPALAISVNHIGQLRPGIYELTLLFKDKAGTSFAPLNLALSRPAVQFAEPGKQTIDIKLLSPFGGQFDYSPKEWILLLRDDSGPSTVGRITLDSGPFSSDDRQVNASLVHRVRVDDAVSPPALKVALQPVDFPVGKSTGKVRIRGDALQTPVTFEVEVISRLSRVWVLLMVALGLVMGWIVRTLLQRQIDLNTIRALVADRLVLAQRQKSTIADAEYGNTYRTAVELLNDALGSDDSIKIQAALDAFKKTMDNATTSLNAAVSSARNTLVSLQSVASWGPLPDTLKAPSTKLSKDLQSAIVLLDRQDAAGAVAALADAKQAFAKAMQTGTASSLEDINSANTMYEKFRRFLDPKQESLRVNTLTTFDRIPDTLAFTKSNPTVQELNATLDGWRTFGNQRRSDLNNFVRFLADDSGTLAELAKGATDSIAVKTSASRWQETMRKLLPLVSSGLWRVVPIDLISIEHALDALRSAVRESLDTKRAETFEHDWGHGGPFLALRNLDPSAATSPPLQPVNSLDSPSNIDAIRPSMSPSFDSFATAASRLFPLTVASEDNLDLTSKAGVAGFRAHTLRALFVATTVQTICVGCVVTWISYVALGNRFVGTPDELLGLFLWGFSADLSVTSLTSIIAPLKAKPSLRS
jgi:hypothetical protein